MADIKVLLREAVPLDEVEADLELVAHRVRQRRRNRATGRLIAGALALSLVCGAAVASGLPGRDTGEGMVTETGRGDGDPTTRGNGAGGNDVAPSGSELGASSATELTRLLARRGWLASAELDWPAQPSDFVGGPPEPGIIVVGTLVQVKPGPVTTSWCMDVPGCVGQTNVETVLRVDLVAPGDQAHPDEMVVPWVTGQFTGADGTVDQATSDRLAAPFVEAAPIGARILVFLRPDDGHAYDWRPVEPSGIVIENGDGVAIPQPDPDAPPSTWTFDDYVAELNDLLSER